MSYFQVITTCLPSVLMTRHLNYRRTLARVIIKVSGYQHRWLAGGYDLEVTFLEVASMVVTWWIVAFLPSETLVTPIRTFQNLNNDIIEKDHDLQKYCQKWEWLNDTQKLQKDNMQPYANFLAIELILRIYQRISKMFVTEYPQNTIG